MENPIYEVESWLFNVAAKKVVVGLAKLIVSVVLGVKVQPILSQLGITVNPEQMQAGIMAFSYAGIEAAHDWAKLKYPEIVKF